MSGRTPEEEDMKRTWYCLSCADRAYSELLNLPISIQMEYLPESGAPPARHRLSIDAHLACSMALVSPHLLWLKAKRLGTSGASRRLVLEDVASRFLIHLQAWFPDTDSYMSATEHCFLKWISLVEMLRLRSELLECSPDAPAEHADLLHECLDYAAQIADETDRVAASGILVHLQDTSATRLSMFGIILHKLYWRFTPPQQALAVGLLKRVLQRCNEHEHAGEMTATAFVARFLRRCLNNIAASRAASRGPTPPPHEDDLFDIVSEERGRRADTSAISCRINRATRSRRLTRSIGEAALKRRS
jgi:hypothetical protein